MSRISPSAGRGPYFLVGNVYQDVAGSLDDAADWYRQALEARPAPGISLLLSTVELDRGDEAAAERIVEGLEEASPGNRYTRIARLNLDMYRGRYAPSAPLAADLAGLDHFQGYFFDLMYPYGRLHPLEPLGYFGVLAGRPKDSRLFFETNFPDLLEDDPPIHAPKPATCRS